MGNELNSVGYLINTITNPLADKNAIVRDVQTVGIASLDPSNRAWMDTMYEDEMRRAVAVVPFVDPDKLNFHLDPSKDIYTAGIENIVDVSTAAGVNVVKDGAIAVADNSLDALNGVLGNIFDNPVVLFIVGVGGTILGIKAYQEIKTVV